MSRLLPQVVPQMHDKSDLAVCPASAARRASREQCPARGAGRALRQGADVPGPVAVASWSQNKIYGVGRVPFEAMYLAVLDQLEMTLEVLSQEAEGPADRHPGADRGEAGVQLGILYHAYKVTDRVRAESQAGPGVAPPVLAGAGRWPRTPGVSSHIRG